jgi:hypothetical protein
MLGADVAGVGIGELAEPGWSGGENRGQIKSEGEP